ncbi:phenylpropionate dioxygenase-like ring-hydroxylating dioxygenase large terminal subunit [Actinoplanes lutulentus]|uniref:Phenylpropionate dioxygenase-like ring-hydroxylating dioxygenase large terminal subunit n=1 Tax=Actinoplanes lutulentus TaxID=1287878 RepID=A0A327ZIX0_9ACTN|nr:aromatic ring-hydroxylating dioxygenase subunit alpha [Actinoplanes lutulentus]MBB2944408.1 phenylpropionate dioxygenase-like ring-hydroxylating dioxygenase large terminal subunit [Actinoplanes lutulentus]RAK42360.1 phenylpropionate dioxygenase-like ring-hydroxylating dioxygenase large terminal subunit [Actinoplanes lutulentus]
MLKNFWYAVEFSDKVTTKPERLTVLGQYLVVYRTPKQGRVVALSDLCVHRGAALSGGTLKDDKIVCPYHGWEYDPDGQCTKIPANLPGRGIPKKARVDSYPVQEKYGFVWVFMGDLPEEERPPMPVWPEFDDLVENGGKFRVVTGEFLWNANYERILENGCDIAHAPFVHAGRFGNPDMPQVPDYEVEHPDEWSAFATVDLHPPKPSGLWGKFGRLVGNDLKKRPPVTTSAGWMLPNMIKLHVRLPIGDMIIYDTNIPIDETHTLVKWVALRTFFTGKWADKDAINRTMRIFYEDAAVVDKVRPELLPFDLGAELHIKSDIIAVEYRRRRQELADKGWLLNEEDFITGDVPRRTATVIPSPARRESPELARAWVHKARGEHPTVAASRLMGGDESGSEANEENK